MERDLLAIVEAAYRVEQPEAEWIGGIAEAFERHYPDAVGVSAYAYEITSAGRIVTRSLVWRGSDALKTEDVGAILSAVPPEYVAAAWAKRPAGYASEAAGFEDLEAMRTYFQPRGIHDMLAINGIDPTMNGCFVAACVPRRGKISERQRATLARVATHLAAASRIRRSLHERNAALTDGAEAILDASGRVHHAADEATAESARDALRRAVKRIERARGSLRKLPDEAIAEWRGLVAARWSLVEHFESDGRRYLVARKNDPNTPGPDALTRRERQVLAYAALGRSNKVIAYDLGIAHSTVGVLMSRAMAKLKARTRGEAIDQWLKLAKPRT